MRRVRCSPLTLFLLASGLILADEAECVVLELHGSLLVPLTDFAEQQGAMSKIEPAPAVGLSLSHASNRTFGIGGEVDLVPSTSFLVHGYDLIGGYQEFEADGPLIWRALLHVHVVRLDASGETRGRIGFGFTHYSSEDHAGCILTEQANLCGAVIEHSGGYTRPTLHLSVARFPLFGFRRLGLEVGDHILLTDALMQHDAHVSLVMRIAQ